VVDRTLEYEQPPKALPVNVKQGESGPARPPSRPRARPAARRAAGAGEDPDRQPQGRAQRGGNFTAGEGLLGGGVYANVGDVTGVSRVRSSRRCPG
jgi:hypothetical protein